MTEAETVVVNTSPEFRAGAKLYPYELIPVGKIEIENRIRKEFKDIDELADSISRLGLDNPLTVVPDPARPGSFRLVAGERRFLALRKLKTYLIPCFVREDLGTEAALELELEENLRRSGLTWQERCAGMDALAELKKAQDPKWRLVDAAAVTNKSFSVAQRETQFGRLMRERPDIAETVVQLPMKAAVKKAEQILRAESAAKRGVVASGMLRKGDSRELLKGVAEESVALVLTDPPYGQEALEAGMVDKGQCVMKGTLEKSDNLTAGLVQELYKWFLPEAFRVLVPGGHLYVFCCADNFGKLLTEGAAAGFECQRYPIVWDKGRTTAPGRGYWYTPCYELVFFAHKPPRRRQLGKSMSALTTCSPVSRAGKIHPFEKPVELMRTLIEQSTLQGELVLDPFCGSGATVVAAVRSRRVGVGFDLDESGTVLPLAEERLAREMRGGREQQEEKTEGAAALVDAGAWAKRYDERTAAALSAKSFRELRPGTLSWQRWWTEHPEDQDGMIVWVKERAEKPSALSTQSG